MEMCSESKAMYQQLMERYQECLNRNVSLEDDYATILREKLDLQNQIGLLQNCINTGIF